MWSTETFLKLSFLSILSFIHELTEIELFCGRTVCLPLSVEEGVDLFIDGGPGST